MDKGITPKKKAAGKLVASGPRARPGIHEEGKSSANSNVFKSGQRSEEKGLKPLPTREKIMPPRGNSEFGKKTIPKATPAITSTPKKRKHQVNEVTPISEKRNVPLERSGSGHDESAYQKEAFESPHQMT